MSNPSAAGPPLHPPPQGPGRRWTTVLIAAFLLLQSLLPLRWYLGDKRGDERFAWRIYSPVSRQTSRVLIYESTLVAGERVKRRVPLASIAGEGWRDFYFNNFQPVVVEELLNWRCDHAPVESVWFERTGSWPDGTPIEPTRMRVECER